jgi:thioesterase domain-containing protein
MPDHRDAEQPSGLHGLSDRKRMLLAGLLAARATNGAPDETGGSARHTVARPAVEPLRTGTGDPIVLIHPVGGNILSYVELVRHLAGGPPVTALASDTMLAAGTPSMPELAAHYITRLDRAGQRPAVLAGWSFGGVIAYEMARQLAADGRPCPAVLLDSMPAEPGQVGRLRDEIGIARSFVHDLVRSAARQPEDVGLDPDAALWRLSPEEAVLAADRHLAAYGLVVGLPAAELVTRYRTYRNAVRVLDTYAVPPHDHPVLLVHATRGDDDPPAVWGPVAAALAVHTLDTDHYDLMRPPFVQRAAAFIDAARTRTIGVA